LWTPLKERIGGAKAEEIGVETEGDITDNSIIYLVSWGKEGTKLIFSVSYLVS
jgi:hypothetical protein